MPLSKLGQTTPLGQGGTLLVKPPGGGPAHRPNPNARPPDGMDPSMGGMQRHPSGYYLPAVGPPGAQAQALQAAQPRNVQVPRLVVDESTSAPGSAEQTRIYRPDRPPSMLDSSSAGSANLVTGGSQDAKPSTIPLVLGAIAFALVGFAVVATLLYLRAH
jgi:hypothetical protein